MGEEGGGRSCGIPRDLKRLKQQAMAYYQENDVPRRLEELLNTTFYLQPADVYGHLVGACAERLPHPGPRCGSALRLRREVAPARCGVGGYHSAGRLATARGGCGRMRMGMLESRAGGCGAR